MKVYMKYWTSATVQAEEHALWLLELIKLTFRFD
jgi:hypothetical protein